MRSLPILLFFVLAIRLSAVGEGETVDAMESPDFSPTNGKVHVEPVAGHDGNAVRFSFDENASGAFAVGKKRATAAWDRAAGFSFWVKGDGSAHLGGLQFIWDEDYAVRYDYAFPLASTDWRKITVAWRDLVPSKPGAKALPLDAVKGNAPSRLGPLWVGKWWYWKEYPAHSFAVDDFRMEAQIAWDTNDYTPNGAPLARTLARLQAHELVTVVTMGDSLTDFAHWANRGANWPTMLKERLTAKFGSAVTVTNPAIGGTQLPQGLVLLPRWTGRPPDLVTILYGYNDWDGGTRGAAFRAQLEDAVDRVRRATQGKSDVLIVTTCPSLERWTTMTELSEACRTAARAKKAGLAEAERLFHGVAEPQRATLYVKDRTHLAEPGHRLVADAVFEAIANGGK